MPFGGFSEEDVEFSTYKKLFEHAAKTRGYKINEDAVERVIKGLKERKESTGYATCPCRIKPDASQAKMFECPCVELDIEIAKKGKCRCGLFYKEEQDGILYKEGET